MLKLKFRYVINILNQELVLKMKCENFCFRHDKIIFIIAALVICLPLNIQAQFTNTDNSIKNTDPSRFKKLFDFSTQNGDSPIEILVSGNMLYGISYTGGSHNSGLIFKIKTDGSGLNKFEFPVANESKPNSLVLSDSILYGTTRSGGIYNSGILYRINKEFTGYKILYNFQKEFSMPTYKITISGSTIYGYVTESLGGYGFIFKINTDGTGFMKLSDISSSFPYGKLQLSESYLYGITWGSIYEAGKIFKLKTDGTEYLDLHYFDNPENGQKPYASLTLVGNSLYGSTTSGGINDCGILFKINTDGSNFKKLYDFSKESGNYIMSKLVLSGTSLYGTATQGGINGTGTLFRISKDGSVFSKLFDFQDKLNGASPEKFAISGDSLFGITLSGGTNDVGTIYRYISDESQNPSNIKVIKLSIKTPEQITIMTKRNLIVDEGNFINLDTTFSVIGAVSYTHSWNVKSGNDFEEISKNAMISENSIFYLFITTSQGCFFKDSVTIQAKIATNIREIENEALISIYPNPFSDMTKITFPGSDTDPYDLTISDLSGKIVRRINSIKQAEFQLTRNGLNSGIYFIELHGLKTCKMKLIIN